MRTRHGSYSENETADQAVAAAVASADALKDTSVGEEEKKTESGERSADHDTGRSRSSDGGDDDDDSSSEDEDGTSNADSDGDEEEGRDLVSRAEIHHAIALASEAAAKTFGWDKTKIGTTVSGSSKSANISKGSGRSSIQRQGAGEGNALSDLIPGYTAPMRLEATYVPTPTRAKSLDELRRRAMQTDQSTAGNVLHSAAQKRRAEAMQRRAPAEGGASSFKLGTKRGPDGTAGSGWFGMVPTALTDEVKTDIAVIRNRGYLDPKRFYKKSDAIDPRFVQVGTVIEGADEYYSSRLTKKQRRQNITEEIMADADVRAYTKKQYNKVQTSRQGRFDQGYGRKKQRGGRGGRKGRR